MFKFIHAADIHLDSPLQGLEFYEGAPVELIRGATRQALKRLVNLAISENVAFVVIAGDLFDGDWKDYNTGLFFTSQMSQLRQAGIKVYIVSGNHDAQSRIKRELRMPENIKVLSTRAPESVDVDSLGVVIHGQGFSRPVVNDNLASAYPEARKGEFNIGVLHTCAVGCAGHEPYAPCTVDDLLSKDYDYWALGHIHKRHELHKDPWIIFSGNIQGRHVREPGDKGCTLVTVDNGEVIDVEHKQLDILRWCVVDIDVTHALTGYDVLDSVSAQVIEEMKKSNDRPLAMRLYITGSCKAHTELMKKTQKWLSEIRQNATDVSGGNVWIEKVFIKTRAHADIEALMKRDDPLGGLLRYINTLSLDKEEMPELVKDFSDLNRKLTNSIKSSIDDIVELNNPENISNIVDDVRQLLIARLLSSGGDGV
jgi:exonuclease SbcD